MICHKVCAYIAAADWCDGSMRSAQVLLSLAVEFGADGIKFVRQARRGRSVVDRVEVDGFPEFVVRDPQTIRLLGMLGHATPTGSPCDLLEAWQEVRRLRAGGSA